MEQQNNLIGGAIVGFISLAMYFCFACKSFRILEENQNKFRCKIRPTFSWAVGIFFCSLTLLSLIVAIINPPITILKCTYKSYVNRQYPSCQLAKVNWLGREQNKTSIVELQEAKIESKLDKNDNNNLLDRYRVVLVTDRGNVLITTTYTYGSQSQYQDLLTIVSQINSFVTKPLQDSLVIELDEKVLGYTGFAFSSFFGLITFIILAMAPYINCFFDRDLDLLTIERRNLFRKTIFAYKISGIVTVKVEEQSDIESSTYRLTIFLRSGEKVPFTYFYTSGWKEKEEMSHRLQNFLEIKNLRKTTL